VSAVHATSQQGVSYMQLGKIVILKLDVKIDVDKSVSLAGCPNSSSLVSFTLRNTANGDLSIFWIGTSSADGIRTYKAVNFTAGDTYSGVAVYTTS